MKIAAFHVDHNLTCYFHRSAEEEDLAKEFSPVYHLSHEDPAKIAPLFIAKAGLDRPFLNESIDEFVNIANERNIPITFMNHPTGEHGFDILNDDARSLSSMNTLIKRNEAGEMCK